jgi:hypothetical protein
LSYRKIPWSACNRFATVTRLILASSAVDRAKRREFHHAGIDGWKAQVITSDAHAMMYWIVAMFVAVGMESKEELVIPGDVADGNQATRRQ